MTLFKDANASNACKWWPIHRCPSWISSILSFMLQYQSMLHRWYWKLETLMQQPSLKLLTLKAILVILQLNLSISAANLFCPITTRNNRLFNFWLLHITTLLMVVMECICFVCTGTSVYGGDDMYFSWFYWFFLCRAITTRNNRLFHFWLLPIIPLLMVVMECICSVCTGTSVYSGDDLLCCCFLWWA